MNAWAHHIERMVHVEASYLTRTPCANTRQASQAPHEQQQQQYSVTSG